jgi:hypothetical protein
MSVVLEKPKVTPEELLRLPKDRRYELVDGELVEKPMSATSGAVGGELMTLLGQHIRAQGLGALFNAETGTVVLRMIRTKYASPTFHLSAGTKSPRSCGRPDLFARYRIWWWRCFRRVMSATKWTGGCRII